MGSSLSTARRTGTGMKRRRPCDIGLRSAAIIAGRTVGLMDIVQNRLIASSLTHRGKKNPGESLAPFLRRNIGTYMSG